MPSARSATIPSQRIEHLMDEAEELFIQEGFLHFSTEALAKRLRCSKRSLYAVAPTRWRFFETVISRRMHRYHAKQLAAVEAAPDSVSALVAFMNAGLRPSPGVAGPTQFGRDLRSFPGGIKMLREMDQQLLNDLEMIITEGVRSGAFRQIDPSLAAHAISAAAARVCQPELLAESHLNWIEALSQLFRLVSHGLLPSHDSEASRERRGRAQPRSSLTKRTAKKSSPARK